LPNGGGLAMHLALVIFQTLLQQRAIQFLKGGNFWDGDQEVPPTEPDPAFYAAFFVCPFQAGCAKM
jgi:hypothetical protein